MRATIRGSILAFVRGFVRGRWRAGDRRRRMDEFFNRVLTASQLHASVCTGPEELRRTDAPESNEQSGDDGFQPKCRTESRSCADVSSTAIVKTSKARLGACAEFIFSTCLESPDIERPGNRGFVSRNFMTWRRYQSRLVGAYPFAHRTRRRIPTPRCCVRDEG